MRSAQYYLTWTATKTEDATDWEPLHILRPESDSVGLCGAAHPDVDDEAGDIFRPISTDPKRHTLCPACVDAQKRWGY